MILDKVKALHAISYQSAIKIDIALTKVPYLYNIAIQMDESLYCILDLVFRPFIVVNGFVLSWCVTTDSSSTHHIHYLLRQVN